MNKRLHKKFKLLNEKVDNNKNKNADETESWRSFYVPYVSYITEKIKYNHSLYVNNLKIPYISMAHKGIN